MTKSLFYSFKRLIYEFSYKFLEFLFLHKKHLTSININLFSGRDSIDIYIVAFNNLQILEDQIYFLRKNILDEDYTITIADNSSDKRIRTQIESLCKQQKIGYISLPKNHLGLIGPSYSHGGALNWIYKHIIQKRTPKYFVFLDHDFFPIKPVSIERLIGHQPFYGRKMQYSIYWYLWAGFSIFKYDFIKDKTVDFMPCKINGVSLDSGGSNWNTIYRSLNPDDYHWAISKHIQIRDGEHLNDDHIEFIDHEWLHAKNMSRWTGGPEKYEILQDILKKYK